MITLTLKIEIFALINCWTSISVLIYPSWFVSFGWSSSSSSVILFFFLLLSFCFVLCVWSLFFLIFFQSLFIVFLCLLLCISWDTFFKRLNCQQDSQYLSCISTLELQSNPFQINHEFYYQFHVFFLFIPIECLFLLHPLKKKERSILIHAAFKNWIIQFWTQHTNQEMIKKNNSK